MTSNVPPSTTEAGGQGKSISVSLAEQGGSSIFTLASRGEVIPLVDSGSLNRWTAAGVIDRHNISVSQDGVTVDGHHILYADGRTAAEQLEGLLNRTHPAPPTQPPSRSATARPRSQSTTVSASDFPARLYDSLKVTRDGFQFHVAFLTRFGENKTTSLEGALEVFQGMRAFKPHVNLQKSGIKIVVTRWDGDNFVEEPGIENIEHATPEEVESLIKRNLEGSGSESRATTAERPAKSSVVRVQLVRGTHDARFHLVLHRADGATEEGPLLIRPNLAKLAGEGLFRPNVTISMTAMNDRVIVERTTDDSGKLSDALPLDKPEDAPAVEAMLNQCLAQPAELAATGIVPDRSVARETFDSKPIASPAAAVLPASDSTNHLAEPIEPPPIAAPVAPEAPVTPPPRDRLTAPIEKTQPAEAEPPHPTAESMMREWSAMILKSTESLPPGEVNRQVFETLRERYERPIAENEHGFPAFDLEFTGKSGTAVKLELVLTPHFLLCGYPFGYMRFGLETRLFLSRLDDYTAFQGRALRGVAENSGHGGPVFIVSDEFAHFFQKQSDRSYRTHFTDALAGIASVNSERLIWPISREERLFQATAAATKDYGLPVTHDEIVLDQAAPVFIGFKKAPPHGMEFRDADDFVRFTPAGVELNEKGSEFQFVGGDVLLGWALDPEGRVCALYRKESGFAPKRGTKLLHFLNEDDKDRAGDSLNLLAWIPV